MNRMTSKIGVRALTPFLNPLVWKDDFEFKNLKTYESKTMYEVLNMIYNDLDVLEIIKKKKVAIDWNSNDVFTFDEYLTKEEENKIKEWMKNDN